jgi:hypothetical protein
MPALAFLAVAGLVLTALLFVADAKLELSSSPAIITSQRTGLPEPQYHHATRIFTEAPAPAPDMTSEAVLAAQPKSQPEHKSEPEHHATIPAEARAARAEAPPRKRPVTPDPIQSHHEQNDFFDRFSIKGQ